MEAITLAAGVAAPNSIAASARALCTPSSSLRSSRISGIQLPCTVSTTRSRLSGGRWRQWTVSVSAESKPDAPLYIGYNPKQTVFPAEACDELGGEFCNVEGLGVEVNPQTPPASSSSEKDPTIFGTIFNTDREYVEYNSEKTVFPGEACDDLGGEFCEPDFQKDVHPESKPAA